MADEQLQTFLEEDKICSFDEFEASREKIPKELLHKEMDDSMLLFACEERGSPPTIQFSLKLFRDMTFFIWVNGIMLRRQDYAWICPEGVLKSWAQLENIWSHHKNDKTAEANILSRVEQSTQQSTRLLSSCLDVDDGTSGRAGYGS